MQNPYFNQSGCADPTAYHALKNLSDEEKKVNFLIKGLKYIIRESGFELLNRIELQNTKTGRIYK